MVRTGAGEDEEAWPGAHKAAAAGADLPRSLRGGSLGTGSGASTASHSPLCSYGWSLLHRTGYPAVFPMYAASPGGA